MRTQREEPRKHALAKDVSRIKDKRYNKLFEKAYKEATPEERAAVDQAYSEPDITGYEMNYARQRVFDDLVQDFLNERAKKRVGRTATAVLPGLAGAAVSATGRQPRYIDIPIGASGDTTEIRLNNLQRFARMLGLGPY
jgi:hypothetical protein